MSTSIEATGHTVDEAIQIALNQLGVGRDKVEIEILHHPRRGFLGIGARRAKVRATLRESVMRDGEEFDMSGGMALDDKPRRRRRRGGRGRGRDGEGTEGTAADKPVAPRPDGERRRDGRDGRGRGERQGGERQGGGRDGRGGDGRSSQDGRGGQDQRRGQERVAGDQQRGDRGPRQGGQEGRAQEGRGQEGRRGQDQRGDRGGRGDRQGRQGRGPRPESAGGDATEAPVAGVEAPAGPPPGFAAMVAEAERSLPPLPPGAPVAEDETPPDAATLEAIRERAHSLAVEMLARMGFPAEVSSAIDETAGEAVITIRSDSEGLLIGRRGQTLDSIEHILNRMTLHGETYVEGRVQVDVGDYRRRRRQTLEELAGRLRGRALAEGRSVQVSPMSPRDRKLFSLALAGDDSVEVRALGAGFYRRVLVAPAGMGAAAVAAAEAAGESEEETMETESSASTAEAAN